MSEYQYYEWQTIDRPLTAAERTAVDRLSSHIEVSATGAWVEYHWSGFRHDFRVLYLAWLLGAAESEIDEELEPPVFKAKVADIQSKYAKRPGLLARIEEAGLA